MIISGNGSEITLESVGKNIKVRGTADFDRKDLSGQSSSTAFAAAGNKPKKVSVSLLIPMDKPEGLTTLLEMAEATDDKLMPAVYTIVDRLCAAAKIRQVVFANSVQFNESDSLRAFEVSFTLQEYKSVPEKKEDREKAKAAKETSQTDGEEKIASTDPGKINEAVKKAKT
ncbi:MAG: hypothetical protein PHH77_03500 [Victivallaceae bacterium]|nr:hypothetical protein [Victivallaceae bacterium]